jgi:hypothetical protein
MELVAQVHHNIFWTYKKYKFKTLKRYLSVCAKRIMQSLCQKNYDTIIIVFVGLEVSYVYFVLLVGNITKSENPQIETKRLGNH